MPYKPPIVFFTESRIEEGALWLWVRARSGDVFIANVAPADAAWVRKFIPPLADIPVDTKRRYDDFFPFG